MKIFEKRPLAIILCVMLGGFSFFADYTWQMKLIFASVPLTAIVIFYIFDILKQGRREIVLASLVALSASLLLSALWSVTFYPSEYYGKTVAVEACICDIDNTGQYSSRITCETVEIEDKRDKHTFILYMNKNSVTHLRQYDIVTFNAEVCDLSNGDDGFSGKSYYLSSGYSAQLDNVSDLKVIGHKPSRIDSLLSNMRLKISNRLKLRTDFNTGSFLSALIVGDRESLSGIVKLNFARLGISHILALSGMHLAILSLAVNSLLLRSGVKKKIRVTVLIALVTFYMALTGFSPSVVRAGLMLIISSILFLLSSKADSLTSLAMAVFIIVAVNPVSVFDLSLWLSAFATLGVIVYAEIAEQKDNATPFLKRMLVALKNGCLISVFAFCATFAFVALRFDSFSIASIITTLIFSFATQFFIYGGMLLLIFGRIIPFGKLLIAFSNGILWLAETISSIRFVYVSIDFFIVKLLIVVLSIVFFSFLVFEAKNKNRGILIILALLFTVFVTAEVCTLVVRGRDDVVYAPGASGDVMLLKSDSNVSAIYSGRAISTAGGDVLDVIADEKLTYLDTLVITSYSHSTIQFVNAIVDGIKIDKIMLPVPTTYEELGQAEGISYLLSEYSAYLEFYEPLRYMKLGEYKYCLFEKADYTYGKAVQNVYEIVFSEKKTVYVSPCEYENLSASAKHLLFNCDNLIIGTTTTTSKYIFDMRLPEIDNIYFYGEGRLTSEALKFYNKKGASTKSVKTPLSLID